jgi:8-oxo-dGTP diphosphatase
VLRQSRPPLIAVVRLRKCNEWVLPKGKLDDGETARAAAMREVLEETGHDVSVHEFLGTLAYDAGGRSKIVHYWRMETSGKPARDLMNDVTAVDWLPLNAALERLSRDHERAFLANVGPLALESARRSRERKPATPEKRRRRRVVTSKPAVSVPTRPTTVAPLPAEAAAIEQSVVAHDVVEREPAVIEDVTAESPPLPGDDAIDAAPGVLEESPEADGPLEMDPSAEAACSEAACSEAVLLEAILPEAVGPDALPTRKDQATIEERALRGSVMQRMRSWLRRAS